jgi:hypothetical protein
LVHTWNPSRCTAHATVHHALILVTHPRIIITSSLITSTTTPHRLPSSHLRSTAVLHARATRRHADHITSSHALSHLTLTPSPRPVSHSRPPILFSAPVRFCCVASPSIHPCTPYRPSSHCHASRRALVASIATGIESTSTPPLRSRHESHAPFHSHRQLRREYTRSEDQVHRAHGREQRFSQSTHM